ncbi:MAG: hypothetical protein ACM3L9_09770 [Deltaproteobacteria bacterium]
MVSQSNSINRYVGRLTGLYPKDDLQAFLCDEVMDAAEDISTQIEQTIGLPEDAKKKAREDLARATSRVTWSSSRRGWKQPAESTSLAITLRWRI